MLAKVVISLKTDVLNDTYTYCIPKELEDYIFIGSRVVVSFGFNDVLGYVIEINETSDFNGNLKEIKEVLDLDKELTNDQIELAKKMSIDLNISLATSLDLMMPNYLKGQKKKYLYINDYNKISADLAILFNGKNKVMIDDKILQNFNKIKKEIINNNITLGYDLYSYGKTKKNKRYILLNDKMQKSQARQRVVNFLKEYPNTFEEDLILSTNTTQSLIRTMAKENIIHYEEVFQVVKKNKPESKKIIDFSFDQRQLIDKYNETNNKPYLLFSNDETFKINFYVDLIQRAVSCNKHIVIVTPNVLLCEEIKNQLQSILLDYRIVSYHSRKPRYINYDTYINTRYDNYNCLVTTMMGIFLPFNNVSAFVCVNEEDSSYINSVYPYYSAIEVLKTRSKLLGSKLIFATSTPSISTFYKARTLEYYTLEMNVKHKQNEVYIVDMKDEILEENNLVLSKIVKEKVQEAMNEKKTSLLIVNNKAFSTQIKCHECGKTLMCPKCHIPLTLYQNKGVAKCNYCDYKTETYMHCSCGSTNFISLGFGLEKVEQEVKSTFPNAKILQVDSDYIKSIEDYNNVINVLEEGSADIIIGTNVLTKTLKYDNIKVVALLYVDSYLNMNDYRGSEYTFNLINKIINHPISIIQTYHKGHYAIKNAVLNDYESYFKEEIENRELLSYEPFYELNKIIIKGLYDKLFHFANYFKKALSKINDIKILGPTYDYRLQGVRLVIKHNQYTKVVSILNDAIKNFNEPKISITFVRNTKGGN